jgi:dynein heavy chain
LTKTCFFSAQPIIPADIIENDKKRVSNILEDQRIGPELRVQDLDDYMNLINDEVSSCALGKLDRFINIFNVQRG